MLLHASVGEFGAGLIGAVVGGAISFLTTWCMAKREEGRAARGAAAILGTDLEECKTLIDRALKEGRWWPAPYSLPVESWQQDGLTAVLGARLGVVKMTYLAKAFVEVAHMNCIWDEVLRDTVKPGETRIGLQPPLSNVDLIEDAQEAVLRGLAVLHSFRNELFTDA